MKKLVLTLTLVAAVSAAYGQGTVRFSNSTLQRLSTADADGANVGSMALTPQFTFGLFYLQSGTAPTSLGQMTLLTSQFGVNSTTGAGLIASPTDGKTPLTLVTLPFPASTVGIWATVAAWSSSYGTDWVAAKAAFDAKAPGVAWGMAGISALPSLGASTGPGTTIWEAATQTNPSLLNAFAVRVQPVPEPTTLALLGLGAAAMLVFRRRQ